VAEKVRRAFLLPRAEEWAEWAEWAAGLERGALLLGRPAAAAAAAAVVVLPARDRPGETMFRG
jgi:hypothetical protein